MAEDAEQKDRTQQLAFQNAFAIAANIDRDAQRLKDRRATLKEALARQDIDWKAFLEARKRAIKNEHTLNLFDQDCMRLETWARKLIAGEKLVEPTEEEEAEAEIDKEQAEATEDGPEEDLAEDIQDGDTPISDTEQPQESAEPLPAAADSENGIKFEDDGNAVAESGDPSEEPEWDMGDAPAADPNAARKTAKVAPAAGAGGVSMDDIPMPKSQIHDLQQEQSKRRFVDRRERITATEYNDAVTTKAESA